MIAVESVDLPATRRASHDAGRIEPGCHLAEGAAIPAPGLASTRRRPAAASDVGMDTPSPWSWTSGSAESALSGQGAYRARWLDQAQVQRSRCGHRKGGPGGEPRRNGEGSPGQSELDGIVPSAQPVPDRLDDTGLYMQPSFPEVRRERLWRQTRRCRRFCRSGRAGDQRYRQPAQAERSFAIAKDYAREFLDRRRTKFWRSSLDPHGVRDGRLESPFRL